MNEERKSEICDIALGTKAIPDDMVFSKEEAQLLVNYKVEQAWQAVQEVIAIHKKNIKLPTEDDRVTPETIEVVEEYLDMVEEELEFPEFHLI